MFRPSKGHHQVQINKLTTHIQRYIRTRKSDKNDTIVYIKTVLKMIIKCKYTFLSVV
jgi:hypothetical protein